MPSASASPVPTTISRRQSPTLHALLAALLLCFLALALTTESTVRFGQGMYLLSAALLAAVIGTTSAALEAPHRWAAIAALGGLIATEIFALTELGRSDSSGWEGLGVLIPPAWLFATIGWFTHNRRRHTFRWVSTLVQLPFTALTTTLFVLLFLRVDGWSRVGHGAASLVGSLSVIAALVAIYGRLQILRTHRR